MPAGGLSGWSKVQLVPEAVTLGVLVNKSLGLPYADATVFSGTALD
jgi:hypothetical protein